MMTSLDNMRVMQILSRATTVIAEGEVLQLLNMHDPDVTHESYLTVIRSKTAKLFEAAAELGALIAGANDAQIEAWTPEGAALEPEHLVPGFRRAPSGADGEFSMRIPLPQPATRGEPVMYVTVFARGLVKHQFTAVFLEDDTGLANSNILNQVPQERRATLLARKTGDGQYHWDIWMQTEKETVFFDYA